MDAPTSSAAVSLARAGSVEIAIVRGALSAREVDRIERGLDGESRPAALLLVLEPGALTAPPRGEERRRLERLLAERAPGHVAVVVEAAGLRGRLVRGLAAAALHAKGVSRARAVVTATVDEAAAWLARRADGAPAAALVRAIAEARAPGPRPPPDERL